MTHNILKQRIIMSKIISSFYHYFFSSSLLLNFIYYIFFHFRNINLQLYTFFNNNKNIIFKCFYYYRYFPTSFDLYFFFQSPLLLDNVYIDKNLNNDQLFFRLDDNLHLLLYLYIYFFISILPCRYFSN